MVKDKIKTENTDKKLTDKPWLFKKGFDERRNLDGRPPEALNFKTKWLLFIDKIAKQNGITPDEVDQQMLAVAYKQMQSGDYRYWKDIQDRVYGQAVAKHEFDGNVTVNVELSDEEKEKLLSLIK